MPHSKLWTAEKTCKLCGKKSRLISEAIGVCVDCLRSNPEALKIAMETHYSERKKWGLPPEPPRAPGGIKCGLCDLDCVIPEDGLGYCGLVKNIGGRLVHLSGQPYTALLEYYYDPHPTNCVAYWFCPGATGTGYPMYALRRGGEQGYVNLAVFYGACNHNCLFCQNWFYRELLAKKEPKIGTEQLLKAALDLRVTCVCFFGGDPGPQVLHAIYFSRKLLEESKNRIMRICWESNGHFSPRILPTVARLSLETGGIVKFDLKAWSPQVYKALTGVDVGNLYRNTEYVAKLSGQRPEIPLFTASVLLVPGYIDETEIRGITRFLAKLSPEIPLSLLAFYPRYLMDDLPPTSKRHAYEALRIAKEEGLEKVWIGNSWLLGNHY
jgi:pyruvate formate lyase activating enzyme